MAPLDAFGVRRGAQSGQGKPTSGPAVS